VENVEGEVRKVSNRAIKRGRGWGGEKEWGE